MLQFYFSFYFSSALKKSKAAFTMPNLPLWACNCNSAIINTEATTIITKYWMNNSLWLIQAAKILYLLLFDVIDDSICPVRFTLIHLIPICLSMESRCPQILLLTRIQTAALNEKRMERTRWQKSVSLFSSNESLQHMSLLLPCSCAVSFSPPLLFFSYLCQMKHPLVNN